VWGPGEQPWDLGPTEQKKTIGTRAQIPGGEADGVRVQSLGGVGVIDVVSTWPKQGGRTPLTSTQWGGGEGKTQNSRQNEKDNVTDRWGGMI